MVASVCGPLSGSGTPYSSDIGVTQSPSRSNSTLSSCKRRLMFTQRIFQGEAIYLDLRTANGSRQRTNLETDLKALGARVEGFLSRDVTHVITDRTDAAAQPNGGAAGSFSSPVATGSKGGSLKTPKAVPAAFSRAQALLNRSVSRQQQQQKTNAAATDPVSLAKQWGIRVTLLPKVLHIIEREKAKCDPNRRLSDSKHGSSKGAVRVRKLEGAFIKVEDMSCQFRPSSKNFASFPVIDVNDPAICHNQSPFNLRRKPQATKAEDNHSSTVKGDVNISKPVPVVKETPSVQLQAEGTPSTKRPAVKQVPKTGFCEVCDTTYRNLKEHAMSDAHQKFALGTDNFNSLDFIISELPSLSQLQSHLSKLSISTEPESNEELAQDLTDCLSEEKRDLNCGVLSESEKGLKTPERLAPSIDFIQDVPMDTAESCPADQSVALMISQTLDTVSPQQLSPVNAQTIAPVNSQTMTPVVSQIMDPLVLQRQSSNDVCQSEGAEVGCDTPVSCSTVGYEHNSGPHHGSTAPYTCSGQPVFISGSHDVCHTPTAGTQNGPTTDSQHQTLSEDSPSTMGDVQHVDNRSFSMQGAAVLEIENLNKSDGLQDNPQSITSDHEKSALSVSQRSSQRSRKATSSESIPDELVQVPSLSKAEADEAKDNICDEVLLLTPYKVAHPMSDPTGMADSPQSVVMPTLTPQKTPYKDFTPGKSNSDMRVLSESAVQAVLKELTFLNNDAPLEFAGGVSGHAERASNHIQLSGDSRSGSDSFPSMPELCAEVGYNPPDPHTNDATMQEPLSSRGSYFDVSPVKLITQFSFGCVEGPESSYDPSSRSQPQFTAVKERTVAEHHPINSHHSDAVLPDSVSDSKSFPTSFSNILSRISAESSQCPEIDNSNDAHPMVLDTTLVEDDSMPALEVFERPTATRGQETPTVQLDISQELHDEQMEFSDVSSDRVENSIAQNLLARLQEQSFSGSEEEDNESAPDVLLHYNNGIQQQALGSDTLAKAAKELINSDNVFCGESVVCDSQSRAILHATLDNISPSPNDTCSSMNRAMNISNLVYGDTKVAHPDVQAPSAMGLPQQWMSALSATATPATLTTQNQPPPIEQLCTVDATQDQPPPIEQLCTVDATQDQPPPIEQLCTVDATQDQPPPIEQLCTVDATQDQPPPIEQLCTVDATQDQPPPIEQLCTVDATQDQPPPIEHMCTVEIQTSDINQNKFFQTANILPGLHYAVPSSEVQQPMSCSQESTVDSSAFQSSSNVNTAEDRTSAIEEPDGRWSPSMILNPVNLWWTDIKTSQDQNLAPANSVKLKTPVKIPPKAHYQSPGEGSKVIGSKVQKKSKKSDKERVSHSSEKRHKKSSKSKDVQVEIKPVTGQGLDASSSACSEDMPHKRKKLKSHKNKSHKSKATSPASKPEKHKAKEPKMKEPAIGQNPDVKAERHKSKTSTAKTLIPQLSPLANLERHMSNESKRRESTIVPNSKVKADKHTSRKSRTKEPVINEKSPGLKSDKHRLKKSKTKESTVGLTPKARVDITPSVTPKVARPVLGAGTPATPTVTWTVTPSRGLKLKLSKVVTPLQEKPVEDNRRFGALYEQHVIGATPSTGKHKHKKHKLDKGHRRRKLDL